MTEALMIVGAFVVGYFLGRETGARSVLNKQLLEEAERKRAEMDRKFGID